jgi:hypothetical protein
MKGHLERVKKMHGYLQQFNSAAIRVCIERQDFSSHPVKAFDWSDTIYSIIKEDIAKDTPEPLGKPVVLVSYMDAKLYYDILTTALVQSDSGRLNLLVATMCTISNAAQISVIRLLICVLRFVT